MSVVLGVAIGQVLPRDTPEVEAARNAFIAEYNRLARLAALAPDVHIYTRDSMVDRVPLAPRPVNPPTFNAFSFSTNLGDDQQFVPGPNVFPGATHMPGHMAGHMAGHRFRPSPAPAPQPTPAPRPRTRVTAAPRPTFPDVPLFRVAEEPIVRWTGPFADEVPAGLSGHVMETPSVIAAKEAHFRAHADFWNQAARNQVRR